MMDLSSTKAKAIAFVVALIVLMGIFVLFRYNKLKKDGVEVTFSTIFFGMGVGSPCDINAESDECGGEKLKCEAETSKCIAVETTEPE